MKIIEQKCTIIFNDQKNIVSIWNRGLTDREIKLLGDGFSPLMFKNGLIFYQPILEEK